MKNKILTTIILTMFCTLAFCQCVKAETEIKTTIQIKKGATSWVSISAGDAYDKCQELNEDNSALGTTGDNVMAHLSTNADWYAVSLLTYSDYGAKSPYNTTGNSSGIGSFGVNRVFTPAIFENNTVTTNVNYQSIIDNKNTKFVEILKVNREDNKPGLGMLASENLNSNVFNYKNDNKYPVMTRTRLFSYDIGSNANGSATAWGGPGDGTTFRPVIWVK